MSYLARISARATGSRSKVPAIIPKGMANRHPPRIARMDEDDEKEERLASMRTSGTPPLRRQDEEGESEEAPTVAREEQKGPEEPEAGEEEVAALRRKEEEGEGDEDPIQPIRREDVEEKQEEVMAMRAIARQEEIPLEESPKPAPPPRQSDLEPDAGPVSDDLAGEQEPSDLQALRRNVSPSAEPSRATSGAEAPASRPQGEALTPFQTRAQGFSELSIVEVVPPTTGMDQATPTVLIDRLDVLIHEPRAQGTRAGPREDRHRALRARYLGRL